MQLKLSCYCCGSVDFEEGDQPRYRIEGRDYLQHETAKETQVTCSKCGLEDYVMNLVITYR